MFNFEKLDVYREAVEFALRIYEVTNRFPKTEVFGIVNQLRRAVISIPSNIAEGSSRSKKEFIRFINISLGSCYECIPLLEVAKGQNYIDGTLFEELIDSLHRISAKISALKKSLQK